MVRIGIPRETKPGERRIVFIPDHVALLVRDGHEVRVASGAGSAIGKSDASYRDAGARVTTPDEAWDAELIVKVKEIQGAEYPHLRAGQALFGYHHLPREPERARALAARGVTAIAFEMVRDSTGGYPLLAPMSVIPGRMAITTAAKHLGQAPRNVLVLGAGQAGRPAQPAPPRHGATVTVLRPPNRPPRSVQ